jgi:hypothetical protein
MGKLDSNTKRILRRECGVSKVRTTAGGRKVEGYQTSTGRWVELGEVRDIGRDIGREVRHG